MKQFILITVMMFSSLHAFAKGATVKVNGMVCSFCSTSIENKFKEKSEVGDVKVDLDTKIVSLKFKDEKALTDEQITEVIKKSGYTVVSITRDEK